MSENIIQLENIMNEELRIFSNILRLEREKSEAILNKDGLVLQKLSQEEEEFLSKVARIEHDRRKLIDQYSKINKKSKLTLSDIEVIERKTDNTLTQTADLLKKILNKIKSLQDTNAKMINDNLSCFKKIIKDLRQFSTDTGYSDKGKEKGAGFGSFLVDKII